MISCAINPDAKKIWQPSDGKVVQNISPALYYSKIISHGMQVPIDLVRVVDDDRSSDQWPPERRARMQELTDLMLTTITYDYEGTQWRPNSHSRVSMSGGSVVSFAKSAVKNLDNKAVVIDDPDLTPTDYAEIIKNAKVPVVFAKPSNQLRGDTILLIHDSTTEGLDCFERAAEFAVNAFVGNGFHISVACLYDENKYPSNDPRTPQWKSEIKDLERRQSQKILPKMTAIPQKHRNAASEIKTPPVKFGRFEDMHRDRLADIARLTSRANALDEAIGFADGNPKYFAFHDTELLKCRDIKTLSTVMDNMRVRAAIFCRPCFDSPAFQKMNLGFPSATIIVVP